MTEEKQNTQKPKMPAYKKYSLAAVANEFVQQGQFDLANTALNEINFSDDMNILIKSSKYLSSQQGIQEASAIFNGEFAKSLYEEKFGNMLDFYGKSMEGIPNDSKAKIENIYSSFKDKTIGDVMKSYKQATETMKLSEQYKDKFSKEDVESAEKTIKKYEPLMAAHEVMFGSKMRSMTNMVHSKHTGNMLEQIASGLPEIKKEEPKADN